VPKEYPLRLPCGCLVRCTMVFKNPKSQAFVLGRDRLEFRLDWCPAHKAADGALQLLARLHASGTVPAEFLPDLESVLKNAGRLV
jgi:hypothetical protein